MASKNYPKNSYLESFNCFESLFHEAKENSVLLIDTTGIILDVNEAFLNAFGYQREDISGKNFAMLFTAEDLAKGLPQKELIKTLEKGQASDNNYLVHKDGTRTWVSGESIYIVNKDGKECLLKIIQNINQQKLSEFSYNRLTDFNEHILTSIEDIVIVLDKKMKVIKANRAFAKFFTASEDADFEKLVKIYDRNNELFESIQRLIQDTKSFSNIHIEITGAQEQERVFDVSGIPFEHMAAETNIMIVMHDITFQRQAEKQREDILGFVAHELRNPIASIILCNQMVQQYSDEGNTEKVNYFLQRGNNNITRLNKMIAELYEATKLQSGNLALEITEFDFPDMVKESKETIEALYPAFTIAIRNNEDVFIKADRYRLIQVITNYLNNAIKYSAGKKHIEIYITKQPGNVQLAVKDNGLGISKLHLPFIFDRFFRAEKVKNMEGIGLGLFLCRQIIQAHKGKVWAESVEGEGSVFYFSIPV